MPKKSRKMKRMRKKMMAQRNRRHRMNFMVLYGEVNQRKDWSLYPLQKGLELKGHRRRWRDLRPGDTLMFIQCTSLCSGLCLV